MIHIDRDRADEQGRPIRPGASWFARAARGRERAAAEAGAHEADPGIYADDWVKAALEELFHRKCAYCEAPIGAEADWNVEHFRPKGRVAERHGHPGYYWLAYEWLNLYPVCEHCNQRRKDRPLWGDLQFAEAGGKQDQFPLEDEATRAMAPGDAFICNDPYLAGGSHLPDISIITPVHHEGVGAPTVKDYLDPLNRFLLETHAVGQNNVLVIDEAQNLSAAVLEQLRLLTNLETNERKLLQIILIGQPLAAPEIFPVLQQLPCFYTFRPSHVSPV